MRSPTRASRHCVNGIVRQSNLGRNGNSEQKPRKSSSAVTEQQPPSSKLTEATYRHFVRYLMKTWMKRLFLILLLCTATVSAQQNTGGLKGRVSDEFGGVIVGATVSATDANGVSKSATTNGEGVFTLAGLAPGKYTIRVSAPGFGTF